MPSALPRTAPAAAMVLAFACAGAFAAASDSVTGNLSATNRDGRGTYSCFGTPTCTGVVNITVNKSGCSNTFSASSSISFTGIDLSRAGSFSGSSTIASMPHGHTQNADGTCTWALPSLTWQYDGTWDGTNGTLTVHSANADGTPDDLVGTFSAKLAAAAPVFPMTVTGSVTTSTTDIEATLEPKAADAGTTQGVYVFAHAPSNLVSGAGPKAVGGAPISVRTDDAVVCVLAQATPDGHLVAVSASTMQAALSGLLTSQGEAVQVLNNVSTPAIAGATFYVGYGTSAAAMLSSGTYQSAVSVPGAVQCMASLASAPAPKSPAALSGLWWNASESGWGIHFTQRDKNLFAAWYTYDAAGNPKWYVAPNCGFTNSNATSGSCSSPLYEVTADAYIGHTFNPNDVHASQAGTLQISFTDANDASLSYTVGNQSRTVAIVRQPFAVTPTATPAVDFTDLWWNPNESGWGMAMAQQFGNVFLAWYVYDANGKPFWYVAPACAVSGSSCSGTLYRTTGPPFGPPLDPTKVQAFAVGSAVVSFIDPNNAVLSYTVDGVSAAKTLTRQLF